MEYVLQPFGIAAAMVLLALLWTFLLQHVIAYPFVFLFLGAIMASAWFGGFTAGAIAIVLSSVLVDFFFIPPLYSIAVHRDLESYFGAFIVCAIVVTVISASRRRSEDLSRAAREALEDRVRERTAELEQSNQEILERERQLRLLAEAIPQQIWRAGAEGLIEYCNRDLLRFTGKAMEALLGEGFFTIFHPADGPLFRQCWDAARHAGTPFETEARVQGAEGSYRWFIIRAIPHHTAGGDLSSWYGVHIDIEERYRAEQSLRAAQGDSARWARTFSLVEMAASIAHELKQPLTALTTQARACRRWLRADPINAEKATSAAESLVRESARASAVIDRVRSLFSEKDLHREAADLNLLVHRSVQLLRDEIARHGVHLRLNLAAELPPVNVDPIQIQQLLLNLMRNGIESTLETGRAPELIIGTAVDPRGDAAVSVRDNGVGLSEQMREKVFDPFFTTKPQGTGIGLSICRSIVEAHDGRIWVEPLREGAAFHVVLGSGA